MINFTHPLWLWGLAGLLIPLTIHMLSRKEGKIISIGSLRHFTESNTARFSSIRLNEILLFIVRCLLIMLLVLLLAGTEADIFNDTSEKWLLMDKGIEKETRLKPFIDSLAGEGYEPRWLLSDFPTLADRSPSLEPAQNYWALADLLRKKDNVDAVVLSYNYLHKFKGLRMSAPSNVRWITIDPEDKSDLLAHAVASSGDSVWARTMAPTAMLTSLLSKKISRHALPLTVAENAEPNDTIRIHIYTDKEFEHDGKIIQASLAAVQLSIPFQLDIVKKNITNIDGQHSDWVIWLSEKELAGSADHFIGYKNCPGNTLPVLIPGRQENLICGQTLKKFEWVLTKRLTEESAVNDNLPLQLASIILEDKRSDFQAKEERVLAPAAMWSEKEAEPNETTGGRKRSIQLLLSVAFMMVWISERWLSFKKNQ